MCALFTLTGTATYLSLFSSIHTHTRALPARNIVNVVTFTASRCAPQDLIDRLIAVNSTAKIRSLFHYEQSHAFGLR